MDGSSVDQTKRAAPAAAAAEADKGAAVTTVRTEAGKIDVTVDAAESKAATAASEPSAAIASPSQTAKATLAKADVKKKKKRSRRGTKGKSRRHAAESSSSDSSDDDSDDSSSEDSGSDDGDKHGRKKKSKHSKHRARACHGRRHGSNKSGHKSRRTDVESDSSSDSSSSSSDESDDEPSRRKKGGNSKKKSGSKKSKSKKHRKSSRRHDPQSDSDDGRSDSGSDSGAEDDPSQDDHADHLSSLYEQLAALQASKKPSFGSRRRGSIRIPVLNKFNDPLDNLRKARSKDKRPKKPSKPAYKRVDQIWDKDIFDYRLQESAADKKDDFDGYVFTVRRRFDWDNKYKSTVVDIKSKLLRESLKDVMKDVRGISLDEDKPAIDPNMLFLYLEELRTYTKKTLKAKLAAARRKSTRRHLKSQIAHCKVMVRYLDHDYKETKDTLYPMLEAGNITFDLLWALFKPNTIVYTTTYGAVEHPRCFKMDYASRESSFMRGEWYCVEGRYLEYDGKTHGLGDFSVDIDSFKGARKIASLAAYPLQYHQDPDGIRGELVERGKRFVSMQGMSYRFHKGLAFVKKKKNVLKVNINGRIMVDPAIFRRINPNYPISSIKPEEVDVYIPSDDDDSGSDCCSCRSEEEAGDGKTESGERDKETRERTGYKVVENPDEPGNFIMVEVPVDDSGNVLRNENLDKLAPDGTATEVKEHAFTEEELLIASPVVLGFAFSEKLWLEFSITGVRDIKWNEGAFDSLVLPPNQKDIVRALVESHKLHAAQTIDDVVQGKGRGLVAVLHGPPGTGKTLTAEGIAELLRCPLYMVSAGELGTQPDKLEYELQKILDIAHSWGAVLLLDEADVFLERREANDIHRNALVSIFLRLLEYFQGILFLTTNRVETFDDAFQSRIHIALRYGELAPKARRAVWKLFLDKVRDMESLQPASSVDGTKSSSSASSAAADDTPVGSSASSAANVASTSKASADDAESNDIKTTSPDKQLSKPFTDADLDALARHTLNGRQIKNAVRTAQALAVHEGVALSLQHIRRVLDVAQSFDRDLRGGSGYEDAMRSYH